MQRKNVVNNVNFKGTMTKWPVQKQTHRIAQKHTEHQDATDIKNTIFVCFRIDTGCPGSIFPNFGK